MFKDEYKAMVTGAENKLAFLERNPLGYFLLSMLAGAYIGFGVILSNTIGSSLAGEPIAKLCSGLTFGIALSLVVICGAELFTGNNMVLFSSVLAKKKKMGDVAKLWVVCWLGNLCGAIILGGLYTLTGYGAGDIGAFMATAAAAKMSAGPIALLSRGILCNILVCLAVWAGFRTKSDAAKLIMVLWCLLAFVSSGFEHSIANMTLFTIALLRMGAEDVSFVGAIYNLLIVTVGNIIGGAFFIAVPYFIASKDTKENTAA